MPVSLGYPRSLIRPPQGTAPTNPAPRLLFCLSLAAVVYLCLYPWSFDFSRPFPPFDPQWYRIRSNGDWVDCVANFLFYVPFGLSGFLSLRHPNANRRALYVILSAALLSGGIEFFQIYVPTRNCNLRDVLFNTAGAVGGIFLTPEGEALVQANGFGLTRDQIEVASLDALEFVHGGLAAEMVAAGALDLGDDVRDLFQRTSTLRRRIDVNTVAIFVGPFPAN